MTPLEFVTDAIADLTTRRLEKKIEQLKPGVSEWGKGASYGQELAYEFFLLDLRKLKELLAPRPSLTAKEAGCPSCGATSR